MAVCCPPTAQPSLFLTDCGSLTLRVRGSAHDGRLIRIRSAKCTVGSAPGCTLRLRADGVEPLHCWVLRGRSGAVIRRIHGAATLNGGTFNESPLCSGDRLRIGAVELEVVECCESAPAPAPQPFPPPIIPATNTAALEAKLDEVTEQVGRLEGEARQGWQSSIVAAERANQLRDALAAADQQLADAGQELTAAQETITRQTGELESLRRQLAGVHAIEKTLTEKLRRQQAEHEAALEAMRRDGATATGAMTISIDQLNSSGAADKASASAEKEKLRSRCVELEGQVETLQQELARGMQSLHDSQDERKAAMQERREAEKQTEALERQLSEQLHEVQAMRQKAVEHAALQSRAEELAGQITRQARALAEAKEQADAARAQIRTQEEQAERDRERAQRNEEIVAREDEVTRARIDLEQARKELEDARQRLDSERGQLGVDREQAEIQRQQLAAELEALSNQRTQLEAADQQLTAERERLEAERQQLAAEKVAPQDQLREYLDQHTAELESRRQALDERVAEFERRRHEFEQEAGEWEARRDEELARSGDRPQQTHAGADSIMPEPVATDEGSREVVNPANVTAPWQPPEELAAEETPSSEIDQRQLGMTAAFSPPAENVSGSSSVDSVLGRLVRAGVWRNPNEPEANEPPAAEAPPVEAAKPAAPIEEVPAYAPPVPAAPEASPTPSSPLAEEDSIESYMDRLLKRVRGESPTNAGGWKQAPAAEPAPEPVTPSTVIPEPVAVQPVPASVKEEEKYVPRTKAPEMTADMSAMRAVANSAAQADIDRHSRKHQGKQAAGRLFGAFLTITASVLLAYWAWKGNSLQAGVGAALGGALGMYWILGAALRILSVLKLNRPEPASDKSENAAK